MIPTKFVAFSLVTILPHCLSLKWEAGIFVFFLIYVLSYFCSYSLSVSLCMLLDWTPTWMFTTLFNMVMPPIAFHYCCKLPILKYFLQVKLKYCGMNVPTSWLHYFKGTYKCGPTVCVCLLFFSFVLQYQTIVKRYLWSWIWMNPQVSKQNIDLWSERPIHELG